MKKATFLFLVLAFTFSFAGCSIAPTTIEEEDSTTLATQSDEQHINPQLEKWIASCLGNGKTDSISYTSSDSLQAINSYFRAQLSKSKHMPCYYSIFESKDDGLFYLEISFDGILLKDIVSNYSFEDFREGYFMIRTSSDLHSITESLMAIYGKNADLCVCKTNICDGARSYYNINIVS